MHLPGAHRHDVTTRRTIHNAIATGRDPHTLDLPPHVLSWHILWLHHAGLIASPKAGTPASAPAYYAAMGTLDRAHGEGLFAAGLPQAH